MEPGDVIRTKTMSKAQLSMVDDSIITLTSESLPMAEIEAGKGKIYWP